MVTLIVCELQGHFQQLTPPSLPAASPLQWSQLFITIMATFYWMPRFTLLQLSLTINPMKISFLYPFYRCGLGRLSNLPTSPNFTKHRTWGNGTNLLHFGDRCNSRPLCALQSRAGQVVIPEGWGEPFWKFPLAMKLVSYDPPGSGLQAYLGRVQLKRLLPRGG